VVIPGPGGQERIGMEQTTTKSNWPAAVLADVQFWIPLGVLVVGIFILLVVK